VRAISRAVLIVDLVLLAVAFVLGAITGPLDPFALAFQLLFSIIVLGLSIVGSLIVAKQPDNRVGWLFLAASVGIAVSTASFNYVTLSLHRFALALPGTVFIAWVSSWIMIPTLISMVILVPLLFPTGHLPSPRWRPVAIFSLVGISVTTIGSALVAGPLDSIGVDNPFGVPVSHPLVDILGGLDVVSGVLIFTLTALSVISRYRHGTPLERLQLRWFSYPAVAGIVLLGASSVIDIGPLGDAIWIGMLICLALLPIAIGIAILRHRLFDIDLVIKRTISYATLTVLLIGLEVVGILVIQQLLTVVMADQSQTFAIALTTLGVAAVFQPARRRIQRWVDRRFDRSRYDAAHVIAGFSARLRDRVDLDTVAGEIAGTIGETMRPRSVSVWVRRLPR
jgi:hypothetical protein